MLGSVSGLAKANGLNFRDMLDFNPAAIPFKLPPQVQMGLQVAQMAGLKIPSPVDIQKMATGQLDGILKGARNNVLQSLSKAQSGGLSGLGDPAEILNKIEWLL